MSRIGIIALFSVLLSPALSQTEDAWDLERCINYALENNISIQQSELGVQMAEANTLQSKMNLLPSLNGFASHGYNWGQTVDPFTNSFATEQVQFNNFSLSTTVTLFNGFQNYNSIQKNQFDLLAAQYDVEAMRNDVSMNVALAYLQVLFSEELAVNAQEQYDMTKLQVDRLALMVDAGQLPEGDLLEIEAQLAQEQVNLINAQNQLLLNKLNLIQLLQLDSTIESFELIVPDFSNPEEMLVSSTPGEIFSTALSIMPQIASAETKLLSSEESLDMAQGMVSPRLTMTGSYGTGYSGASRILDGDPTYTIDTIGYTFSTIDPVLGITGIGGNYITKPFGDQLSDNLNQSLSFTLNIPIFNGWQTRTGIEQAKIGVAQAQLVVEQAKNTLMQNIQQAYADSQAALLTLQASEESVQAMELAFEYTTSKWELQTIDAVTYNDAKTNLNRAKSDMIQAKYDYIFKVKILEFYQGKPITF